MSTAINRCTRCVLPETYPQIKFGDNGVCNVCLDYDQKWSLWKSAGWRKTEIKLAKIFNSIKKMKLKYDCLVPFSGGKDSTYVLYVCKNVYKLNVLAFNFNNGFQTEEAISNVYNIAKLLEVDLYTISPRWALMKELYTNFLLKTGEACTPCNIGIELGAARIAQQEKIPLIVFGFSPRTEECSPEDIYTCNNKYFINVTKRSNLEAAISVSLYKDSENKSSFINRKKHNLSEKFFKKMDSLRIASLFNTPLRLNLPEYIEWNENEIFDILKNKLKWEESSVLGKEHMDCVISPLKSYLRYLRWGFGSKTQKYAAMVRDGQLNRDIALELIKEEGDLSEESLKTLLNKLHLSPSHIKEIKKGTQTEFL